MKNPDRDRRHSRRREAGESGETPDGKAVAAALYGGDTDALKEDEETEDEPTLFSDENDES